MKAASDYTTNIADSNINKPLASQINLTNEDTMMMELKITNYKVTFKVYQYPTILNNCLNSFNMLSLFFLEFCTNYRHERCINMYKFQIGFPRYFFWKHRKNSENSVGHL